MPMLNRCAIGMLAFFCLTGGATARAADLIGELGTYMTEGADTLLDIAHINDLGYVEIRAANPSVDPWLPGVGKKIILPTQHILPDAPRRGIVINLPELRLYYFPPDGEPRSFPIGIGGEGKETPIGRTTITRKKNHPVWVPTKSEREEDPDLPASIGPGQDNPMGEYALYMGWRGYAIHGTNKVYSIGRRDSHGCIRLYPEDIQWLFSNAAVGTPITVVDQPAKVGWTGGELFLEVHSRQADVDSLESKGTPLDDTPIDADALIVKAAGDETTRLDWPVIYAAERKRDGVPVQITHTAGERLY